MIPFNALAPPPGHVSTFNYPVKTTNPIDLLVGWELGGVGIQDVSEGLLVKLWTVEAIQHPDDTVDVVLSAPGTDSTVLFSGLGIVEVDLAFDQNMNIFVAYVQQGVSKYYWWDPIAGAMVHSALPDLCRSPRCCLDDRRVFNSDASDILLCYVNPTNQLCVRYQRDRYAIENVLLPGVIESLVHVGMNSVGSVQFGLGYY
jgi:hypothetical protein